MQDRTGNRHTLTFPAAQSVTTLTDDSVVSELKFTDEFMGICRNGRVHH